jgi:prepilin-type N-terminal cleavage/methylation domain-containing protein
MIVPWQEEYMRRLVREQDEGFTLIELLIVVAILAIMVSIVTISFTGIMESTDSTLMDTETRLVQVTIDRYNSWDVYVLGKTDITANSVVTPLPSSVAPFSAYLATTTHYCYTWGAKGADLKGEKCPTP